MQNAMDFGGRKDIHDVIATKPLRKTLEQNGPEEKIYHRGANLKKVPPEAVPKKP